jgi:hypothetical protein
MLITRIYHSGLALRAASKYAMFGIKCALAGPERDTAE